MSENASPGNVKGVKIDATAIVHESAELDTGVEIGAYSVVGEDVRIGKNTRVHSHVVIDKWTTIGEDCEIFQFCSIGAPPQDLTYEDEKTELIIGDRNVIREFVTMHRATTKDECKTVCGNDNFLMNYVHVAHDCKVGNNIIMANAATLAGHVEVEDYVVVGGIVAVHQNARIGAYSMIGGVSAVSKDVPPYVMAAGNRAKLYRLNSVGLRRCGFAREDISEIKEAYRILFASSLKLKESIEELKNTMPESKHAARFIEFIAASTRGIVGVEREGEGGGHE